MISEIAQFAIGLAALVAVFAVIAEIIERQHEITYDDNGNITNDWGDES